jgi:hypothetical protein
MMLLYKAGMATATYNAELLHSSPNGFALLWA